MNEEERRRWWASEFDFSVRALRAADLAAYDRELTVQEMKRGSRRWLPGREEPT